MAGPIDRILHTEMETIGGGGGGGGRRKREGGGRAGEEGRK